MKKTLHTTYDILHTKLKRLNRSLRHRLRTKKTKTAFAALLVIIILAPLVIFLSRTPDTAEAWWDDTYQHRKRYSFTHNADLTDRRVEVTIDTATLISNNKMQSDCDDTRFTDANGALLRFDLTGTCNNAATTYDVLFPTIINGDNAFYFYYANPTAINASEDLSSYPSLSPSGGAPSAGSEETTVGPIAYWKFDEGYGSTAQDSVHNYDGTITEANYMSENCISNSCLDFDGTNDKITANSLLNQLDLSQPWTVTGFFNADQDGGDMNIIAFVDESSSEQIALKHNDSNNTIKITSNGKTPGNGSELSYNQWYHFALVWDGADFHAYLDGALDYSVTPSSAITWASIDGVRIGDSVWVGTETEFFNGKIDEVKVYAYARTATQIQTDSLKGSGGSGGSASFGSGTRSELSNGLVGYWKMDESSWTNDCSTDTVLDSSGNDNHGDSCPNTTGPTGAATGRFGNGGYFDGSNDYIRVDQNSVINQGEDLSIAFWLNSTASSGDFFPTILSKDIGGCPANDWFIDFKGGGTWGKIRFWDGPVCDQLISTYTINDGSWHHVVITRNMSTGISSLYIDGQLDNTLSGSTTSMANTQNLIIGAINTSSNRFGGNLDEIRFYNRVLSATEVTQLYKWAPGPIAYYNFDEGSGTTTVYDKSGNSNNGTMNGSMTQTDWVTGKFGNALELDGIDDYISINDPGTGSIFDFDTESSITLMAWLYPPSLPSNGVYGVIYTKGQVDGTDDNNYAFQWGNSSGSYVLSFCYKANGDVQQCYTSGDIIQVGQWQHVAVTYTFGTGSSATYYHNGININGSWTNGTGNLDPTITDKAMWIGANDWSDPGNPDNIFPEKVDDIRIYNYARTPEQIIQDMNAGHPAPGSPVGSPVLHLKFDEGYGDTANDSSPQSTNGDLGGSGQTCPAAGDTTCPSWSNSGKYDKSLQFSATGTEDYVDLGDLDPTDGVDELTISLWVNHSSSGVNQRLVNKWTDPTGHSFALRRNSADKYVFDISGNGSGNEDVYFRTDDVFTDTGEWHHLIAVFNGTQQDMKIYRDGVELSGTITGTARTTIDETNSTIIIGQLYPSYSDGFTGYIDELKIYSFAMTASQIATEYNAGKSATFGTTSQTTSGAGVSSAASAYCPPGSTDSCTAPVAEWLFDESSGTSAYDTSENNNTGTITGASWTPGKAGFGWNLSFDGSNDYIRITDNDAFTPSALSVEAWVKFNDTGTDKVIVSKWDWSSLTEWLLIRRNSDDIFFEVRNNGTTAVLYVISDTSPITNTWYHVVGAWDGGLNPANIKLYINGIEEGNGAEGGSFTGLVNTAQDVLIGDQYSSGSLDSGRYFNGLIDNVKIYNYGRTATQVAWSYDKGAPIAWWKLDDCTGTTANDSSGNGNNGTITIGGSGTNTSAGTCSSGQGDEAWNNGTTGKRGASLDFDGDDDYISIADDDIFDLSYALTFTAWVNIDQTGAWDFITKWDSGADERSFIFGTYAGTDEIRLALDDNGTAPVAYIASTTDANITNNVWHHVAVTWETNTDTTLFYVDGVNYATTDQLGSSPSTVLPGAGALEIGVEDSTVNNMDGQIDEVKIYNYALTEEQIKLDYSQGAVSFE